MKLSIIIPANNEEEVIAHTIESIEREADLDYEIIVVNDHSIDNTVKVVEGLRKKYSNLRLIDNDREKGFANALRKGFSVTNSDLLIPVMADLCDDPGSIKQMYERALDGFDVVCGSRYINGGGKIGGPVLQSLFSKFVCLSLKYLLGLPISDASNSFKCYRKNALENIYTQSKDFEISLEIALKAYFAGFTITEVATIWKGRSLGKSKFYLFRLAPKYIKLYLWAIFKKFIG